MKTILVDDEPIALKQLKWELLPYKEIEIIGTFQSSVQALKFAENHRIDFAVLDIEMPVMGGIQLGKELRKLYPEMVLIYVTGYANYIKDAILGVKADYYFMKPFGKVEIEDMVRRAKLLARRIRRKIRFRTFGRFDMFINEELIYFSNAKAKELLALCVDHEGGDVWMEEAVDKLWGDRPYDERTKNLYRKAVSYCRRLLNQYGYANVFQSRRGRCHIQKESVECDLFQYKKDPSFPFEGEYMIDYEWARETEAKLIMSQLYKEREWEQNRVTEKSQIE